MDAKEFEKKFFTEHQFGQPTAAVELTQFEFAMLYFTLWPEDGWGPGIRPAQMKLGAAALESVKGKLAEAMNHFDWTVKKEN